MLLKSAKARLVALPVPKAITLSSHSLLDRKPPTSGLQKPVAPAEKNPLLAALPQEL